MRLLPRDPSLAWTPYAWLIYLPIFLVVPLTRPTSALEWSLTAAGIVVFLALYFLGYWVSGWKLLLVIVAIFALGAGFAPWNPNSSVFIIYAGAFAGRLTPPRRAVLALASIAGLVALESWVLGLPLSYWVISIPLALVVGGVNIHFQEVGRAAARLRESQEQVQQLVRIAERERIARDLHDLLGHTLSVIALKAELAGKLMTISPERAAAEMRDVERVTRDALREVRGAVAGYRSEGLSAELARARLALEAAGVRPEYFTMPVELPPAVEAALALAVREAVTNVIRHAGASLCRITLDRQPGLVRLEVADDGRGGAHESTAGGTGLLAMRERLCGQSGRVEIYGANPGEKAARGTRLVITVPLRADAGLPAGSPVLPAAAPVPPSASALGAMAAPAASSALAITGPVPEPGR